MILNVDEPEKVQDNLRITNVTHAKAWYIKPQRIKPNITDIFHMQQRLDGHGIMETCSAPTGYLGN